MKNIFIYILIVAIIALAGVLAWQFWPSVPPPTVTPSPSPSPDETADWKVCRNEEWGFEFKYPPNILNLAGKSEEEMWVSEYGDCFSGGFEYRLMDSRDFLDSFSIIVCYLNNESFQEWIITQDAECIDRIEEVLENAEKITIDGEEGIEIVRPDGGCPYGNSIAIIAYFQKDSKIYRLTFRDREYPTDEEISKERERVFNGILSTFKFID